MTMPHLLRRVPDAGICLAQSLPGRVVAMTGFGLAGLSGIGVNQLLLWLLVDLASFNFLVAAVAASVGSTTSNFLLVEHVVFRATRSTGTLRRYAGFIALTAATMPIRLPILYVLTSLFHVHYLLSNLVGLLAIFFGRYAVSDLLIWRARRGLYEVPDL